MNWMEQFENGGAGVILYWKDLGRGIGKKGGALTDAVAGVWGSQIYLQLVNFFFLKENLGGHYR